MNAWGWLQLGLYAVVLLLLAKPLGAYMAAVYDGRAIWAQRIGGPLERLIYRGAGVDPAQEMDWKKYAMAMLWFNLIGALVVYALQRAQQWLPLNPQDFAAVSPDSSFNSATSFITNTNWQGYGGESTMSYLTQMLALAVQNFVSAASGMAVLVALVRGFVRKEATGIGNFWADLVRTTVYVLLPLSIVFALVLVSQGVPQTFDKYATVTLTQPSRRPAAEGRQGQRGHREGNGDRADDSARARRIADRDQAARHERRRLLQREFGASLRESDAAIELPRNAGDPADSCCALLHVRENDRRYTSGMGASCGNDARVRPVARVRVRRRRRGQPGVNMEGKEVRFGVANSALWAVATTSASNGSVNSMHDSFMPLAGMIPMWLIQLGEVIYGGVGSGLYGMIMFALVTVFIAGLMIGRTPEYLGKKIGAFEIKMASIAILIPPFLVLCGTALGVMTEAGRAGVANPAEHGFSEILYAFSSAGNNNGSAFAGLSANTPFYNSALGITMLFARYWLAIPVLALAGAFAAAKRVPPSAGTLATHTPLFVFVLISVVITVGALTFVPALALGPVVEHLLLFSGN